MLEPKTTDQGQIRIWVTPTWYIPVNSKGYSTGFYSEGALGLVLELRSSAESGGRLALKIPRLQADTVRENAHISDITEKEVRCVLLLLGKSDGKGTPGLITPQVGIELKHRRAMEAAQTDDAFEQHEHVIFVAFEKGKAPRFCSVNVRDRAISIFPAGIQDELEPLFRENWPQLVEKSSVGREARANKSSMRHVGTTNMRRTVDFEAGVCCLQDPESGVGTFRLDAVVIPSGPTQAWYGSVPSIAFPWATGTLQKAISRNELKDWTPLNYYTLFENIVEGVMTLHSNGMLHGDIRPANVMALGDLNNPKRYVLIDYGSFAEGKSGSTADERSGNTMVGTGVGPQRASPFYSRERRAGVERESADAVLILHAKKPKTSEGKVPEAYILRLGWRENFVVKETDSLSAEIVEETRKWANGPAQQSADKVSPPQRTDELRPGDRLRIQDYIFEVESAGELDQDVVCVCRSHYAKVLHDRLAVYGDVGPIADESLLGLPRYTEFRQWSAASDVYSIGALSLYTLFCSGQQVADAKRGTKTPEHAILAEFAEMIDILESVPYFQSFWIELEKFRAILESYFEAEKENPGANAATIQMPDEAGKITLRAFALQVAANIVQSTPHAKDILRRFDLNLAHFLLFMHFVMCCLHRRDDMPRMEKLAGSSSFTPKMSGRRLETDAHTPFAEDRTEPPREHGAADRALKRLLRLKTFLGSFGMFTEFKCKDGDVAEFNPTSELLVKVANLDLQRANNQLSVTNKQQEHELSKLTLANSSANQKLEEIARNLKKWKGQRSKLKPPMLGKEFVKLSDQILNDLEQTVKQE